MKASVSVVAIPFCLIILLSGCTKSYNKNIPVDSTSSIPGGTVTMLGETIKLAGTPIRVGDPIPATVLVDAFTMKSIDVSRLKGKVLFLSLVPSLDTKVCDAQTHYLGDKGARLPNDITRITISRDTPFAQKRFAEEAKLTGITYLSDYRNGSFGFSTGLLQKESMLLARAVLLIDQEGIVRYIQVVPELSHLPDMETAFNKAGVLAGK